jgi:uncharacterized protein YdhG (YjbR/CyaY superfamily)
MSENRTVDDYLKAIPSSRRSRYDTLMQLIMNAYPEATVDMQYRMPTFHNAGIGWCALANQKHYISLYTCGARNIADFKIKHPQIKCGKGCINLTDAIELPIDDLKLVIDNAMHASEQCQNQ